MKKYSEREKKGKDGLVCDKKGWAVEKYILVSSQAKKRQAIKIHFWW